MGNAAISGDQIRQASRESRIEREELQVPEFGGAIFVRGMSGSERDKLEESFRIKKGRKAGQVDLRNFRASRVSRVVVNAEGERLLNDTESDIAMLGRFPSGVLDRIIAKSEELSGRDPEEVDDLKNDSASPAASAASSSISLEN